jgi:hypothetical protein
MHSKICYPSLLATRFFSNSPSPKLAWARVEGQDVVWACSSHPFSLHSLTAQWVSASHARPPHKPHSSDSMEFRSTHSPPLCSPQSSTSPSTQPHIAGTWVKMCPAENKQPPPNKIFSFTLSFSVAKGKETSWLSHLGKQISRYKPTPWAHSSLNTEIKWIDSVLMLLGPHSTAYWPWAGAPC